MATTTPVSTQIRFRVWKGVSQGNQIQNLSKLHFKYGFGTVTYILTVTEICLPLHQIFMEYCINVQLVYIFSSLQYSLFPVITCCTLTCMRDSVCSVQTLEKCWNERSRSLPSSKSMQLMGFTRPSHSVKFGQYACHNSSVNSCFLASRK